MGRHFNADRGNIEHLPFFMRRHRHRRQTHPTLATGDDRVNFRLIGRRHPLQGITPVSRLTPTAINLGSVPK